MSTATDLPARSRAAPRSAAAILALAMLHAAAPAFPASPSSTASPSSSAAPSCAPATWDGIAYTACEIAPSDDLRLFQNGPDGTPLGSFDNVAARLAADGLRLRWAMNGGMYHRDRAPVGLTVVDGTEIAPLVTRPGPGNFGLLPNGVFCHGPAGAQVIETLAFAAAPPDCRIATQSGPMLVIDGALHPRFLPDSTSRFIRNGIGVRPDGTTVMAITDVPVNFHSFARLFRDGLGTPDALYVDGNVSRLYDPQNGRHDIGFPLGPILGVAEPAD